MADIFRRVQSERLWKAVLTTSNDAMLLIDEDLRIRACNARALELYGYTEAELLGMGLRDLRADWAKPALESDLARALAEDGLVFETEHVRKDGELLQVEVSTRPLELERGYAFVHAIRDISGRKQVQVEMSRLLLSEQVARAAAEQAQDRLTFLIKASGVLASSLDYETTLKSVAHLAVPRIADWCLIHMVQEDGTTRLVEMVLANPDTEKLGEDLRHMRPPDRQSDTGVSLVVRTGKPDFRPEITDEDLVSLSRDERELALFRQLHLTSWVIAPLVGRDQRVLGTMSLVYAESGRHYGSADLALAEELARHGARAIENARLYHESLEAVRARDMFISVASHELKTPLTIIQGYAELLKRQLETAAPAGEGDAVLVSRSQLTRRIESVYDAAGRLTTLINELLDINRMQRGALQLQLERVNLSALLTNVVTNVLTRDQVASAPRGVKIDLHCPAPEVWGNWDHSRIEQVLVNLIDNAVKYSPEGGAVDVDLAVEPAEQGATEGAAQQAHLIVKDHGIGIPPEEIGRIFQPFMRATNAAQLHFPGLGLGLAISREIVEHHGGRIWVTSAGSNRGTSFHVILPGAELERPSSDENAPRGGV